MRQAEASHAPPARVKGLDQLNNSSCAQLGDPPSVELSAGASRAMIALRGAELTRWRVAGREMIWTPDAAVWADSAPILFPVVGWTREGQARVDGVAYPLGLHGFARACAFAVESRSADRVVLILRATEETRALYPFAFALRVEYALEDAALAVALSVENTGSAPMPYACGLHPGFRWPFDGGAAPDYRIVFDAPESPRVPIIAPGGLFSHETRPVPIDGRELALAHDLFAREALCLIDARSAGLTFERRGGAALRVDLDDFPHLALWSRVGAPFLSIEAWTGHGDPVGFTGELRDKPSMRLLPPGARARHAARFAFAAAGALGRMRET
jgi:galactose mutarotase-like enzyme